MKFILELWDSLDQLNNGMKENKKSLKIGKSLRLIKMKRKCSVCGKKKEDHEFDIRPFINHKNYYICSKDCYRKWCKNWLKRDF